MNREESHLVTTSDWVYEDLPNVSLGMFGRLSVKSADDFEDFKTRSHYDQFLNWRIDEAHDEFVIRFSRKPEAPSLGHIKVDVKIEGGLSTQPDSSVLFDGGLGNGEGNKVSKFSLSFEISHESSPDSDSHEEWEQPEEHEIKFFHHPEHKLVLAPENHYNDVRMGKACDACMEPISRGNARWVYECPSNECNYGVHAKCAQLARTIRHPSHRKHRLQLQQEPYYCSKLCDVCKGSISCGLYYNCAKCDFDLHPECPEPEEVQARGDGADDAEEEGVSEMTPALMQMRLMQQQMQNQMQLNMSQQLAASMANAGLAMYNLT